MPRSYLALICFKSTTEYVNIDRILGKFNPKRNSSIFHHPAFGDFVLQHLPVGVNDSRFEDKIIQHLAAAATMGRTHHVRQREDSRNRSVTHKALKTCILQVWSSQVTKQTMDEKLGRMVTRAVLPQVVMHSRYHYGGIFG
nr:RING-H2 group F2A [Tanacetum cinerariifolium]